MQVHTHTHIPDPWRNERRVGIKRAVRAERVGSCSFFLSISRSSFMSLERQLGIMLPKRQGNESTVGLIPRPPCVCLSVCVAFIAHTPIIPLLQCSDVQKISLSFTFHGKTPLFHMQRSTSLMITPQANNK